MPTSLSGGSSSKKPRIIGQRVLRPRQQVEEALREAVLDGQLRTGERLPPEAELARQFSVSRPTIREALSALDSQGLIRKVPGAGGGSFVQAIDHAALGHVVQESMHNLLRLGSADFDEVAKVRQHLEVPAVIMAAQNRTEDGLGELRIILSEQKTRPVDDPFIAELDAQFHIGIANMSGNRILAALVYALHKESEPVEYLALSPDVGRDTYRHHHDIVKAIADQDVQAAERAMTEHLTYLREHIGEHFRAQEAANA